MISLKHLLRRWMEPSVIDGEELVYSGAESNPE